MNFLLFLLAVTALLYIPRSVQYPQRFITYVTPHVCFVPPSFDNVIANDPRYPRSDFLPYWQSVALVLSTKMQCN